MLGQIANFCLIISRNSIVKTSTSLADIWQQIRQPFGFQSTGAHFLDLANILLEPDERSEDLFQRLTAFLRTIYSPWVVTSPTRELLHMSMKKCRPRLRTLLLISCCNFSTPAQQPRPSATHQPGPSATHQPGPSATQQPRPSATQQPGSSATHQPGPSATHQPGPSATQQPRPSATHQPGPSATHQPGPSATQQPRPSATQQPGLSLLINPSLPLLINPSLPLLINPGLPLLINPGLPLLIKQRYDAELRNVLWLH